MFSSPHRPAHTTEHRMVTRGFFEELRWQWRDADHSLPTSAEVKTTRIYAPTPPIRLEEVVLN
jgi:hypothetical protein